MPEETKTLKDEFAMSSIAGCIAKRHEVDGDNMLTQRAAADIAHDAYQIADAMLDERSQP